MSGLDAAHRLALGQWFTPPAVARLALSLALPDNSSGTERLLDPACGDGSFLRVAEVAGFSQDRLFGIELDLRAAEACARELPDATLRRADLFDVEAEPVGFDLVVGNPPYVRQERLSGEQKVRVRSRLELDWPDAPRSLIKRITGRGDLAAACVLRALRLARPGARIALVVSSAMLHASYADALWTLVHRYGRVLAIVDSPNERWFADAAVNTVILVMQRGADKPSCPVSVARLRVAIAHTAHAGIRVASLGAIADVRQVSASEPNRWIAALRAEPHWFDFAATAGPALVPLTQLAEVRRGITSGANDVFYMTAARAHELGLEHSLVSRLVRAPSRRGPAAMWLESSAIDDVVLCAPSDASELATFPAAAAYLASHENCASRASMRARAPWWVVPNRSARLFLTKAYAARFVQRLCAEPVACDQRVYALHPRAGVDVELLAAVLNSTFTAFALESLGRASMGQGALEWTVGGAERLPVIDLRRFDATTGAKVRIAFDAMKRRPVGTVVEERDRADRAALDNAVAGGLDVSIEAVRDALVRSVDRRLARARASLQRRSVRS